jgi:hypothetical protein
VHNNEIILNSWSGSEATKFLMYALVTSDMLMHSTDTSPMELGPLVAIAQEAGMVQEPVWMLWRWEACVPHPIVEPWSYGP